MAGKVEWVIVKIYSNGMAGMPPKRYASIMNARLAADKMLVAEPTKGTSGSDSNYTVERVRIVRVQNIEERFLTSNVTKWECTADE